MTFPSLNLGVGWNVLEPATGLEPGTFPLQVGCSAIELRRRSALCGGFRVWISSGGAGPDQPEPDGGVVVVAGGVPGLGHRVVDGDGALVLQLNDADGCAAAGAGPGEREPEPAGCSVLRQRCGADGALEHCLGGVGDALLVAVLPGGAWSVRPAEGVHGNAEHQDDEDGGEVAVVHVRTLFLDR